MRAYIVESIDHYVIRDDVETLPLGPRDVKIQMKSAGVCRSDLSVLKGKFPAKMPCVNGHEGAGVIIEVGSEVHNRSVRQRVLMGQSQCGHCFYCAHQAPWFCETKDPGGAKAKFRSPDGTLVTSNVGKGTWAEETIIPADMAIPIPDAVPFDVASLITCAVITGTIAARDYAMYCDLYLMGKLDLDSLITSRGTLDDLPGYMSALDTDPHVLRQVIEFQ